MLIVPHLIHVFWKFLQHKVGMKDVFRRCALYCNANGASGVGAASGLGVQDIEKRIRRTSNTHQKRIKGAADMQI